MTDTPAPASDPPLDFDHVALRPGQSIGRYEILSVLGQGGFGITYRARDVQLGREVAIKEYLPSALAVRQDGVTVLPRTTKLSDDFGWGRERFVVEGRTLASLHRVPAIVQVFDFLEANGTAYIVMELLHGETLEARIARLGKLGPEDVDRILWPLLDGLEQVHAAGFLHRDIKPANILLDGEGRPTLIDFGASRAAMAGRSAALTAIFTPGYAAAEQMTSARQGAWTDIYGLAATVYHAIVGKAPPSAFDRLLQDDYEPLARLRPAGFAPGVLTGIDAGLIVAARDRPQSIAGWRSLLGLVASPDAEATVVLGKDPEPRPTVVGSHPATLVPSPPPAPAAVTPARSRRGLWLGVAALVLVLAGGAGFALMPRGPDPETVRAQQKAAEAEAARQKAEQDAAQLRAAEEQRQKDEQAAALKRKADEEAAAEAKRRADAEAVARKQLEDETRRKIEAELQQQKRAEDEARKKTEAEEAARRKAVEDARRAIEFVSGGFDHFGKSLMLIGLKGHADEIRLQGVDIVADPDLHKLAVDALAAQPRDLRCRQTDRLTDGTPLYRCLVTPLNAKPPLAEIPDSERVDLAFALVRNGLLLASCDAPRSYADAEDEARQQKRSLWGRVNVPEYKRRCTK